MRTQEILSAAPALTGQASTTVLVDEKDLQNILDELLSALQMLQEAKRALQAIKRNHRKMAKDLARINKRATKTMMQMWIDEQRVNEQRLHAIETQQNQLLQTVATVAAKVTAVNDEFFTLAGYYQLRGQKFNLTNVQAQQTGKTLKRKSQELGYVVGNAHSEKYGRVNTYHRYVLQVVLGF